MSVIDSITKNYMQQNAVFADVFNFLIYDGRPVIEAKKLRELDTTELAVLYGQDVAAGKKRSEAVQKYRDVLKSAVIMQDQMASYVILGIENQTDIHYAMPVRNLVYDGLQYSKQVSQKAAGHRKKREKGTAGGAEFLSGFYKEDKLFPVITLVIHFGADEWDGPLSLHEMMPELSAELAQYVQNYRIHLIDPSRLTKEELHKFTTSFREVMECIKCSKDKEQMKELLHDNPRMQMDANAARVISAVTSMELEIAEGAEVVDMCKAIDDMMSESRQEGISLGVEEGRSLGIAEGRSLGITEGEAKGIIETGCEFGISKEDILSRLQKKLNVSMEQAQEYFSIFGKQTV